MGTDRTPGMQVAAWRAYFGLTQDALAERIQTVDPESIGISRVSIVRIEQDKQGLTARTTDLIARAFGVAPSSLLWEDPYREEDITALWRRIDIEDRSAVIHMLRRFAAPDP